MKNLIILLSVLGLAACEMTAPEEAAAPAAAPAENEVTAKARAAVAPVVLATVPGDQGAVITDCILTTATNEELRTMGVSGLPASEVEAVMGEVMGRDAAVNCVAAGLAA